jgi:calcium-dependent protein kinase
VQLKKVQVKWNDFIKMKKKKFSDDYYIMTQIGKGGFGSVYKVMMKNGSLLRAAKKIEKSLLKPEEHENLLGEMSIMMSLDHPNIAKLYEVYDQSSYYVMVMELCEGGELFERIINEKIEEEESIIIIKQILSALNYMHTQGIIHRDIKPENMLFEKSSKRLKLIDFGISTKLAPGENLNQRVGTPYYIAPEVLLKRYNEKSDLWSTGVVAFMIVTGKPPFKGRDPQEVM